MIEIRFGIPFNAYTANEIVKPKLNKTSFGIMAHTEKEREM